MHCHYTVVWDTLLKPKPAYQRAAVFSVIHFPATDQRTITTTYICSVAMQTTPLSTVAEPQWQRLILKTIFGFWFAYYLAIPNGTTIIPGNYEYTCVAEHSQREPARVKISHLRFVTFLSTSSSQLNFKKTTHYTSRGSSSREFEDQPFCRHHTLHPLPCIFNGLQFHAFKLQ